MSSIVLYRVAVLCCYAAGQNGKTALHYASASGHVSVVGALLDRGADATLADQDGNTALSLARAAGKNAVIQLLSSRGAGRGTRR